ncbi:DUF2249 domain-containing protein [Ancylomarina sp. 16SWW S1-10-2]|uniref:DUF2249 domain-containing protein n=1 Tax=Ancylomarina sp. 16SWW S1-10-2 TaxID=2499681 RepID=UPI00189DDDF3|nr:DUF2249 domain-containing protein [Ancylomarina sp. 16SWW S1-10-2]
MENTAIKNKEGFIELDVRSLKGNFLLAILKKAKSLKLGEGIKVIQNFEPIPLYSTMENIGFVSETEKLTDANYVVYFYRTEVKEASDVELPLKPIVMPKFAEIDKAIADLTVNFWDNIWNKKNPAIELKTKLLLSLTNAVGSGRIKQATRELIKSYYLGTSVAEFDELFSLIIWNQGNGHFASEIAQSPLFKAYITIKNAEKKGKSKKEIMAVLTETFGEKNPETGFNK